MATSPSRFLNENNGLSTADIAYLFAENIARFLAEMNGHKNSVGTAPFEVLEKSYTYVC